MSKTQVISLLIALFIQQTSWAELKSDYKAFIPTKWKIIEQAHGDFNADHLTDIALIIEDTNPKNIIKNESLGNPELNTNPRKLLVLFNTPQGYKLIASNPTLPTEGDVESPCLADPLGETEALEVKKNILKIRLYYWLSCGSWYVTNNTYTFRYQNSQFKLIGYDSSSFHRASGDISKQSVNFLTYKVKTTSGENEFNDSESSPTIQWSQLKNTYNFDLNTFDFNTYSEFE